MIHTSGPSHLGRLGIAIAAIFAITPTNVRAQMLISNNGTTIVSINPTGQAGLQLGSGKTVYSSAPQALPTSTASSIIFGYTGQISGLHLSPAITAKSSLKISADGNVYNPWGPPYMENPAVYHSNANNINAVVDAEFPVANRAVLNFVFSGANRTSLIAGKSPNVATTNPTTVIVKGGAYAPNSTNAGYDYGWASYWY